MLSNVPEMRVVVSAGSSTEASWKSKVKEVKNVTSLSVM